MVPTLPHDILREISAYWAGHRLHYTCRALYTSWNPDAHVIVDHSVDGAHTVTTRRMPNGAYHGVSTAADVQFAESIEYRRGLIVMATFSSDKFCVVETIMNRHVCRWSSHTMDNPADVCDETLGTVYVSRVPLHLRANGVSRQGVALRDFAAVARGLAAGVPGACAFVEISSLWNDPMPQTCYSADD